MKQIFIVSVLLMLPALLFAQTLGNIDEIAPFSEGLAAIRKGNQWGFMDKQGELVIDFRGDLHWNPDADTGKSDVTGTRYPMFRDGRCLITEKVEDGIPVYGFIDTKGNVVIEPRYLNVYPFNDGLTTGVLFDKKLKGENEFKLKIYEFRFFDVLVDTSGEIDEYFEKREAIQMTSRRYQLPEIGAKIVGDNLVAVHLDGQGWEIRKITTSE